MIWFLMKNYEYLPKVKELVDTRAFYLIPTINPEACGPRPLSGGLPEGPCFAHPPSRTTARNALSSTQRTRNLPTRPLV
jgi:hypothetical protein